MDFARLHALHEAGAFFLIRAKRGLRVKRRSGTGRDHASRPAPHAMAQEVLSNPARQRRATAPAAQHARRRDAAVDGGGEINAEGQWSILGRRRATLMRHEVGDAAVGRGGFATGALALAAPSAPAA